MIEAFLVSLSTVSIAEMGDRTQLLSLVLAAKFRKPWQITLGVLLATIANHAAAGLIGVWFGRVFTPTVVNLIVGLSLVAMAVWTLKPDTLESESVSGKSAFLATLAAFFIAEIGDKTQIATIALAAAYRSLFAVVAGTTLGMMAANIPVIFLGSGFASRLPLRQIHVAAATLFFVLGFVFLFRAFWH